MADDAEAEEARLVDAEAQIYNHDESDGEGEEEMHRGEVEAADEAVDARFPEFLPRRTLKRDDPDRMQITAGERQMALNIKQAVADNPDINMVSDFMCAQLALLDGDDIEHAMERLSDLQAFREEYDIRDSIQEGVRIFADYLDLMPGLHLSYTFNDERGNYVMIYDNTKFKTSNITSEKHIRCWLGGTYYTLAMYCPDFEAIRRGAIIIVECEGHDWKQHFGSKIMKRMWSEIATVYPCGWEKVQYFNNGLAMNIIISMVRPFLPEALKQKLEFGCQFEQRLDTIYLVPSAEEANLRLLVRVEESLRVRYYNEHRFSL